MSQKVFKMPEQMARVLGSAVGQHGRSASRFHPLANAAVRDPSITGLSTTELACVSRPSHAAPAPTFSGLHYEGRMNDRKSRRDVAVARSGARQFRIATPACTLALLLCMATAAVAQRPATPPTNRDDLRPLTANSMDVAEGKQLAQHFCADCHGQDGISPLANVPNLAGQRGSYLYREMRAYLSGMRGSDTMNGAITYLSADPMSNVAAYYATLSPAPPAASGDSKGDADVMQAGKAAAAPCAGCHGEIGISKMPGIPSLVGQEPKYLVTAMTAYKSGDRKNDIMKAMIAPLTDGNLDDVALFYALQKPARAQTPAAGDRGAGQGLSAPCAACHGAEGVSGNRSTPSLAGQDAQYLGAALHAYKDNTRGDPTMKALTATLDDAAIQNLAAYYAALQPKPPNVRKPLTAGQWAERCDRCHGVNGNSTDPRIPALAAQRAGYLEKVLDAYRTGARRSPEMAAMSEALSPNDVRNLAAYYARQKAQAVVYMPMPAR
jgi:cytochrome c553